MITAILIYKCRNCGDRIKGASTAKQNLPHVFACIRGGVQPSIPGGVMAVSETTHECKHGGFVGICDLIGAELK